MKQRDKGQRHNLKQIHVRLVYLMIRTRGKEREIKINRRTVTSLTGMKKCYLEKTREERWRINKHFYYSESHSVVSDSL